MFAQPSFSSPSRTAVVQNLDIFLIVSQVPEAIFLFIFFSPFSLLLRLGNFYCSVFQFMTLPSGPSILLLSPLLSFIFSYCSFQFSNSIWFFVISSTCLLRLSVFSFASSMAISQWGIIFYDGYFQSLPHFSWPLSWSQCCILSLLEFFLELGKNSHFHLNAGHFWLLYYEVLDLISTFCFCLILMTPL